MTQIRLALMLYFSSWLPTKLYVKPCRRPSWSLRIHGRGLAGAGDISHRGFLGWRAAVWCSSLLWSLPVLEQWSSPLAASICSVWSSAWLCLGCWWGWSFGTFGTAAGCFLGSVMTKDLVHRVSHSPVCQILSHIVVRAVITSCPPGWTSSAGMF